MECKAVIFVVIPLISATTYQPTWESLDARPLPPWYDDAKIGIFIHWGVFSVPSFGSEWFWEDWKRSKPNSTYDQFMTKNFKPGFTYADFGPQFTAEFYDPNQWADLFEASGAKYVVFVSKHHEGFCNWATNVSFSWNSIDVGPHRDLLGDLAHAIRSRTGLKFGVYHSLYEWFNQLYLMDKANKWSTQLFTLGKTIPELKELVNKYKPEVIWSDGDWEASDTYWTSKEFLAWLYNESPVKDTVVVNDRWGQDDSCKHGGFFTCADRYNPGVLQKHKWENAMTLDKGSWGYRRNVDLSGFLTLAELIKTMAETISCGGNILINVGPTHDGRIIPIFEERLRNLGNWLKLNGEAVYSSRPWVYQNDTITPNIWYTKRRSASSSTGYSVYAFVLSWPGDNTLRLGAPVTAQDTDVALLGYNTPLKYKQDTSSVTITMPNLNPSTIPCKDGWVLRLDNLKNGY